ncbi:MAG TPA: DUF3224 domain-containing protein [Candidatus Limnocylindrales bacterium]|nr:DUF3224 domain-containing protein [Candidatus Limnocylindrales bacterium]
MQKLTEQPTGHRGTFEVLSGDDEPWQGGGDGEPRLTRVTGKQRFGGDIEGDGSVAWLMCYLPAGGARFVGLQRIEGRFHDRRGGLVLESVGDHDGRASKGEWRVVQGAGTGDLQGVAGHGRFDAPGGRTVEYELELVFEAHEPGAQER